MSDKPSLLKIPMEAGGKPEPAKVSEMLLEFAEPMLYADPAGPPSAAAVRSIMQLAEMCWNLPVLEPSESPLYASAEKSFDQALAAMPSLAPRLLRQLIEDRKTKFAAIPFSVILRVEGSSLDDLKVVAEARMSRALEPKS